VSIRATFAFTRAPQTSAFDGHRAGYTFPHSGASLCAEWDGWIYKWDPNTQRLDTVSAASNDKTPFERRLALRILRPARAPGAWGFGPRPP
jgi:hypothetical protein